MGLEAKCTAHFGETSSEGKALLETSELIFRGAFKLNIPLKEIKSVETDQGRLTVKFPESEAIFDLGAQAEKWALKIRSPKNLIDKLGVKADSRVVVWDIEDEDFWQQLRARTPEISKDKLVKEADLIFFAAESRKELSRLDALQKSLKKNGAIWVIWLKGRKEFGENDVREMALSAGLVDVKVVSFSAIHSGLKLVIPVAQR